MGDAFSRRFAGAGLFDSVTARPLKSLRLDATADPLLTDAAFQQVWCCLCAGQTLAPWGLMSRQHFGYFIGVDASAGGHLQPVAAVAQETLVRIAAAAVVVEVACGGIAQDVEGVVAADGRVWVVQTRPQV